MRPLDKGRMGHFDYRTNLSWLAFGELVSGRSTRSPWDVGVGLGRAFATAQREIKEAREEILQGCRWALRLKVRLKEQANERAYKGRVAQLDVSH